jgi:hypothetical protein
MNEVQYDVCLCVELVLMHRGVMPGPVTDGDGQPVTDVSEQTAINSICQFWQLDEADVRRVIDEFISSIPSRGEWDAGDLTHDLLMMQAD